jgi:hypothetical protein
MCLNEARRETRLNDIVRQENMCGGASNGDNSGRHGGFFQKTRKRKERHYVVGKTLHGGVL